MDKKYPYLWVIPVLAGIVFVVSNFVWLVPFVNGVREDANRYQLAIAQRVAGQVDFFLEKKLRELANLAITVAEKDLKQTKTKDIINDFLEKNPDFLSVQLTKKSNIAEGYILSPVFETDNKKVVLLKLSLSFLDYDIESVINLSDFVILLSKEKIGERGFVYVLDEEENIIFHPHGSLVINKDEVLSITAKSESTGWFVVAEDPIEEALAEQFYAIILASILTLIGLMFVVILIINFKKVLNIALREKSLNKAKTEYISLLAHKLRTPLSGTKWNLSALIDGDWGSLNEQQKKFLSRSYDTNEQMIKLIKDLLSIVRIEEGRFGFKLAKTDLTRLIYNIVQEFRSQARKDEIKLKFIKPKSKIFWLVDVDRMGVAIRSLIDNAISYNLPKGKVEILLKKDESNNVIISVKDTGIGVPKKQMKDLFVKFFRGDNVVKLQKEGFGLGLYIAKNIVEGHGGKIFAHTEENKGSVFSIILPEK